jgi:hypothetical protein
VSTLRLGKEIYINVDGMQSHRLQKCHIEVNMDAGNERLMFTNPYCFCTQCSTHFPKGSYFIYELNWNKKFIFILYYHNSKIIILIFL